MVFVRGTSKTDYMIPAGAHGATMVAASPLDGKTPKSIRVLLAGAAGPPRALIAPVGKFSFIHTINFSFAA
jgi:hypothetical protein